MQITTKDGSDSTATPIDDAGGLFMGHWARLRRMVEVRLDRRLHGRVDPSDVLQEAHLEFARSLPLYRRDPRVPLFHWLRHLTGVKLMALHRRHLGTRIRDASREDRPGIGSSPENSSVDLAGRLLGRLTSPSQAAARAELVVGVSAALDGLAAIDREVLSLRHFEQLTNAEAAQVLGIGEAAASNRYMRALKRLRPILQGTRGLIDHVPGRAGEGRP